MNMLENRVIDFPQSNLMKDDINLILDNFKLYSENTYKNYLSTINEFFEITFNKAYNFVSWGEFLTLGHKDIILYRNELVNLGNANTTINTKVSSVSSFFKELSKFNSEVDYKIADLRKLIEEDNAYGTLSETEVHGLVDYSSKQSRKPINRSMFFWLSYVTAMRKNAILTLEWSDLSPIIIDNTTKGWLITKQDKGKINKTPITNELYNELLELKKEGNDSDRLFSINEKTLYKTLYDFCKDNNIDKSQRKITLHSLKKASADKVYSETGDIVATSRHCNHSDIKTTAEYYLGRGEELLNSPSFNLFDLGEDLHSKRNQIEQHSQIELVNAIMGCDNSIINKILNILEKGDE